MIWPNNLLGIILAPSVVGSMVSEPVGWFPLQLRVGLFVPVFSGAGRVVFNKTVVQFIHTVIIIPGLCTVMLLGAVHACAKLYCCKGVDSLVLISTYISSATKLW